MKDKTTKNFQFSADKQLSDAIVQYAKDKKIKVSKFLRQAVIELLISQNKISPDYIDNMGPGGFDAYSKLLAEATPVEQEKIKQRYKDGMEYARNIRLAKYHNKQAMNNNTGTIVNIVNSPHSSATVLPPSAKTAEKT